MQIGNGVPQAVATSETPLNIASLINVFASYNLMQ